MTHSTTPLLDKYYPDHQTGPPIRTLERVISDLWYQHPVWPSTFSGCHNPECRNGARGGQLCADCMLDVLCELVGTQLAVDYWNDVESCAESRRALYAALTPDPESCTPGDAHPCD